MIAAPPVTGRRSPLIDAPHPPTALRLPHRALGALSLAASAALLTACVNDGPVPDGSAGTAAAATSSVDEPATFSGTPTVCVLNAGGTTGLGATVNAAMTRAGFTIAEEPTNLVTSAVVENTVFYRAGQRAEAQQVADAVPGGAQVQPRPAGFTRCGDAVAVVVLSA
ncbi:LytR C-terminal domain-containing protein [Gordonia sp. VNK21]|uniref:LytR C-terminal domain-containing protein n=1 Tax=Gordonia sp. VNK21 TaxID=3382483 RepID=UPI0038D3EA51